MLAVACGKAPAPKALQPPKPTQQATTITAGANIADTANVTTYPQPGPLTFTPAAGDLVIVFIGCSGTTNASPTLTDSGGLTFTQITRALFASSNGTLYAYVANSLSTGTGVSLTFTVSPAASGMNMAALRVGGMAKAGTAAVVQAANQAVIAVGNTPAPTFGAAVQGLNIVVGAVDTGNTPPSMTPPPNFTEVGDIGYSSPVQGLEWCYSLSGFTGTTVTWGNALGGSFAGAAIVLELDVPKPYLGFTMWFQP